MDKIIITVIIPTFNRADILSMCLEALSDQSVEKAFFQVIVVDDGSTDNTREVAEKWADCFSSFEYLYQENCGQGNARNKAISHAWGEIVLFIGDDIFLSKDCLKRHIEMHELHFEENSAVLGLILWHGDIEVTDFMKWLVSGKKGGPQFAFDLLEGQEQASFDFFYTSNISLKKSLLERHKFDANFKSYGWEDIELAYRLTKEEDLRIYYCPGALAYHHHEIDEKSLKKRMQSIGKSLWVFHNKYPELKKIPTGLKKWIFCLISRRPFLLFLKVFSKDRYFYALSKRYFLEGLEQGRPY